MIVAAAAVAHEEVLAEGLVIAAAAEAVADVELHVEDSAVEDAEDHQVVADEVSSAFISINRRSK